MSLDAIHERHIRRRWEPEEKQWHDDVLEMPWEEIEPPLHKETVFALKNVFFFSHATSVQAATLPKIMVNGTSAVVEAPTGSGKTLGFLIPLMERTVRQCDAYVAAHGSPPLNRNILGVILSPSRALAEQTFVVAKNLAARFPYSISFVLCDGIIHSAAAVMEHLTKKTRGGGVFLVTTPKDFADLLPLILQQQQLRTERASELAELLADQDEETRRRYELKQQRKRREGRSAEEAERAENEVLRLYATPEHRFVLVVDEADYAFNSPEMFRTISGFIEQHCKCDSTDDGATAGGKRKAGAAKPKKAGAGKRPREEVVEVEEGPGRLDVDIFLVGATVATSQLVGQFATDMAARCRSRLSLISTQSQSDFFSQLKNKYMICDAYSFLPYLVQLMNLHSSKKHFVFFNSPRALLFAQRLFAQLCQGARPILFIKDVYVMYEGMPENSRIDQYNKFLTHVTKPEKTEAEKEPKPSEGDKKNQVYTSGWKRSGKVKMGSGTILLCTDIAAYGLDVRDVDYVYHFEPPSTVQAYVHRVGRVGRMGMHGCSVLLLPCIPASDSGMLTTKERKTTSTRFNTVRNTKVATGSLQTTTVGLDDLSEEKRAYVAELSERNALEELVIPPFAPITSTIRNIITQDEKLVKLARTASISMCEPNKNDTESWFTPKLALRSLLLD